MILSYHKSLFVKTLGKINQKWKNCHLPETLNRKKTNNSRLEQTRERLSIFEVLNTKCFI